MNELQNQFKAAVVQTSPVLFNRDATIEKVARLTTEAAACGARPGPFSGSLDPGLPTRIGFWNGRRQPLGDGPANLAAFLAGSSRCSRRRNTGIGGDSADIQRISVRRYHRARLSL